MRLRRRIDNVLEWLCRRAAAGYLDPLSPARQHAPEGSRYDLKMALRSALGPKYLIGGGVCLLLCCVPLCIVGDTMLGWDENTAKEIAVMWGLLWCLGWIAYEDLRSPRRRRVFRALDWRCATAGWVAGLLLAGLFLVWIGAVWGLGPPDDCPAWEAWLARGLLLLLTVVVLLVVLGALAFVLFCLVLYRRGLFTPEPLVYQVRWPESGEQCPSEFFSSLEEALREHQHDSEYKRSWVRHEGVWTDLSDALALRCYSAPPLWSNGALRMVYREWGSIFSNAEQRGFHLMYSRTREESAPPDDEERKFAHPLRPRKPGPKPKGKGR